MTRDPRVNPKPGDVLRLGDRTFTVSEVSSLGVRGQSTHPTYYPTKTNSGLIKWRGRYRNAEVLNVAD